MMRSVSRRGGILTRITDVVQHFFSVEPFHENKIQRQNPGVKLSTMPFPSPSGLAVEPDGRLVLRMSN